MTCAAPLAPAPAAGRPLRRVVTMLGVSALVILCCASLARADPAPQQWLPTGPDLVRSLRPCPAAVSVATAPVCWAVSEDHAAWMALPAGSPYPWGQCTYYAGLMRPDLWNDRAPPSADPLSENWDAWTWVEHAQAEGLPVDGTPQPGDVMVYSRAAVANQTGHVAIVDAVGAAAPAARRSASSSAPGVALTISEMNVDGLDAAALGQGDTMTIVVPRSQIVPGLIQFIHRPAPGYVPPVWPAGSEPGAGAVATVASAVPTVAAPSLSVGIDHDRLETVSESTAPVVATVTAVPGGAVVKQMHLAANRVVALQLPGGAYRVCVSQAGDGLWPAAGACATGAWQVPVTALHLHAGRARTAAGALDLPVAVAVSGPAPVRRLAAVVRVLERRRGRWIRVARLAVQLRSGRQLLRLTGRPVPAAGSLLQLQIPAQTQAGYRIAPAQAASRVG